MSSYDFSLLYGLNGVMLLTAALVLVLRRNNVAVRAAGVGIAGFLLAASFAIIAIPLLIATYDELLYTPICRVTFVLYCLFWMGIAMLAERIILISQKPWCRSPPAGFLVTTGLGGFACLALIGAERSASRPGKPGPECDRLPAGVTGPSLRLIRSGCGAVAASADGEQAFSNRLLAFGHGRRISTRHRDTAASHLVSWRPMAWRRVSYPAGAMASFYEHYLIVFPAGPGECVDEITRFLDHELSEKTCMPPLGVIEAAAAFLPTSSIVMSDPLGAFSPMGFVPARLAAPFQPDLYFRNWETAFPRFRDLAYQTLMTYGGVPFFAAGETPEQRYADARALNATDVLVSPPEREAAILAAAARPDLFKLLLDRSGWVLLGVTGESQAQPAPIKATD